MRRDKVKQKNLHLWDRAHVVNVSRFASHVNKKRLTAPSSYDYQNIDHSADDVSKTCYLANNKYEG